MIHNTADHVLIEPRIVQVPNLEEYKSQGLNFCDIFPLEPGHRWAVYSPVSADSPWSLVENGDLVNVTMVPYLTNSADPAIALAYAWTLGFNASQTLRSSELAMSKLVVSVGTPLDEVLENGRPVKFRFWLGLAAKLI